MKTVIHSHNGGGTGSARKLVEEVIGEIDRLNITLGEKTAPRLRSDLLGRLRKLGWSNPVPIKAKHKITITACHNDVGLCLQTGNASRLYADLMKLQVAFLSDKISQAIIVLPSRVAARSMGRNIASFDRLVSELGVFRAIITMPIVVVGISQ